MPTDTRSNHPTCDDSPIGRPLNSPNDGSGFNEGRGFARSKCLQPEEHPGPRPSMVIIVLVIISMQVLNAV
jgi:hypothetical protein